MKSIMKNIWIGLFLTVLFVSCGYQFERGGHLITGVTHVAVLVLDNESSETGAGVLFANELIREIILKTDTKVVEKSKASAVIEGTVKSVLFSALSRSSTETVIQRRVKAFIDLKMISTEGKLIWSVKNFISQEDYTVTESKVTDDALKRVALDRIARKTAEKIVTSLQNDF